MSKPSSTYKKFPSKHKKFIGNDCLWFGDDHLLLVESTGISENYKRFYFKDIQAVNILKTRSNSIKTILLGILLGLSIFLTLLTFEAGNLSSPMFIFWAASSLIFLFMFIWFFRKGTSCRCFMYSSVQKEKLTPVNTLKKATKFLDTIVPKIETRQGVLAPEALQNASQRVEAAPSAILKHGNAAPRKQISLSWHRALFLSLMAFSIFGIGNLLFRFPALYLIGGIAFLLILLVNIVAIVKQASSTLGSWAKGISITSLVFMFITIGYGYVEFFYFMTQNMEKWVKASNNQWELAKYYTNINPFDYPIIVGVNIFLSVIFFILGAAGLILLWRRENQGNQGK